MVKIVSLFVSVTFIVFAISCKSDAQSDTRRFDTAFVQKMSNRDSLLIKVYIKAKLMVHDPVSLLKPHYYTDTMFLIVPDRHENFVKFDEVQIFEPNHYPFVKGGITFGSDSVKIDLAFYDYDQKVTYAPGWNGTYLLKWIR